VFTLLQVWCDKYGSLLCRGCSNKKHKLIYPFVCICLQVWCDKYGSLLHRMSFAEGSFFEGGKVPAASSHSNCYAMRQILHDWSDADCISILKQVSSDLCEE
jgi:hypothetical protein